MRIDFDAKGQAVFALQTTRRSLGGDPPHPKAAVSLAIDEDEYPQLCTDIAADPTPYTLLGSQLFRGALSVGTPSALHAPEDRRDPRPLTRALRLYLDTPSPSAAQSATALRALVRLVAAMLADQRGDA